MATVEKEFFTFKEAERFVGCKRGTLYALIKKLDIQPHKFEMDRKAYLSKEEVKRLKEVRERPWFGLKEKEGKERDK